MSYVLVDTSQELEGLKKEIAGHNDVVFADIESTGLDFLVNDILIFQIMLSEKIYIVDVRRLGYGILKELVEALQSINKRIVFHNAKFDIKFLKFRTDIMLNCVYDTMTAEAVLNSGIGKTFYSLEELVEKYTDVFMDKTVRKEFVDFPSESPFTQRQLIYSAMDVKVLEEIYNKQMLQFRETKQERVIELESDLVSVVAMMEFDGIRLDTKKWLELEKENIIQRDELVKDFNAQVIDFLANYGGVSNLLELAQKARLVPAKLSKKKEESLRNMTDIPNCRGWIGENFNIRSNTQLKAIFNLMKINCPNTNEKTLEAYKKYPIVGKLIEIRGIIKQIDQYGSHFLKDVHPVTGKIHTEYLTVGTRTGRFSSMKPNLQNIPVHGGFRECFIPDEDYLFAAVDYSQQEYRLAGAVSREPVIIHAYQSGSDMHTATGKIVAKKDVITKDERSRGKTVNFAILYGSTEWGLKKNLKIKVEEASQIIKDFWAGYPVLDNFMKEVGKRILELGYSITPLGRRRYNPPKPLYGTGNEFVHWEESVLREGKNHIIQGGGADILKIAMVEIARKNPFGNLLKLTLQIHDELVCQVHKSIAQEGLEFIKMVMKDVEQRFLGDIPAEVDGDLKEQWSK